MSEKNALSPFVRIVILCTVTLGSAGLALRATDIHRWSERDAMAFLVLVIAICVAEQFSIPLRHRTETVNFALTDGLWAAALPLVRPSVLTFAIAGGVLLGQAMRRWSWYKVAFNVGQFLVGITAAELVYSSMHPGSPLEPATWLAVVASMAAYFVVNACMVVLVVSHVEGKGFLQVFRPPLVANVMHWAGNTTLGILGAVLWRTDPVSLPLLALPVGLSFLAYRQWIRTVRERNQMRDLYEAGRTLASRLDSTQDFRPFLALVEQMLKADSVELVVLDDGGITVHDSTGTSSLTAAATEGAPLEAFVRVREGTAPQIALIGEEGGVRGVLAVYLPRTLNDSERSILDTLAAQIAVRLQNHRLFFETFEHAQLADILTHTSDGIFVVERDRRIASWNPAMERITGISPAGAVGRSVEDVFGLRALSDGSLAASLDPDPTPGQSYDALVPCADGSRRWIRHTGRAIRDQHGAFKASVVVARDVTAELQAEQMKKDFVAMVSHELRTPLTPLQGFLKTLVNGDEDTSPEDRQEYYRIMLRQTDRLEHLIADLLEVSQIEDGQPIVELQAMELSELVSQQVAEFAEAHQDRTLTMLDLDGPTLVRADPFRVQQVLGNLLSNALKYSPPDAAIQVSVLETSKEAIVSVRDHGEGIPEADQPRVFERFYRVESGRDQRAGGTGLGLYISRRLVEAMDSRLWLVSRPGEGSTFSFSLPKEVLSLVENVPAEHA
ncbi:MAG: ATP-binding protein [Actinomycetota bacterium]